MNNLSIRWVSDMPPSTLAHNLRKLKQIPRADLAHDIAAMDFDCTIADG